jgi:rare lipoprotein A
MIPPENLGVMRPIRPSSMWPLLVLALAGCVEPPPQQASTPAPVPAPSDGAAQCSQVGIASWYRGSSRGRVSPQDLVAAHRSLPFGTSVQVTAIDTGQSVVVRINDRGPFGRGRIIDLSRTAADQLGIRRDGVARVRLEPVAWAGAECPLPQARSD